MSHIGRCSTTTHAHTHAHTHTHTHMHTLTHIWIGYVPDTSEACQKWADAAPRRTNKNFLFVCASHTCMNRFCPPYEGIVPHIGRCSTTTHICAHTHTHTQHTHTHIWVEYVSHINKSCHILADGGSQRIPTALASSARCNLIHMREMSRLYTWHNSYNVSHYCLFIRVISQLPPNPKRVQFLSDFSCRHDSFVCVTWLIHMRVARLQCDVAYFPVYDSFGVIWRIHMTHSYKWHYSFMYVIRLIQTCIYTYICEMIYSYMRHDSFMYVTLSVPRLRVTRLIHTCGMTYLYVWHGDWLRVIWHISLSMTHLHVTWLIHPCFMTQVHIWNGSFLHMTWHIPLSMTHLYVIWLIHTCNLTHSYV